MSVTRSSSTKAALKTQILAALDGAREGVASAQRATQQGATHEEARPEGSKDMRSTETSYIARGQAMRVGALDEERARVAAMELRSFKPSDPVAVSALVTLAVGKARRTVFIAPGGAGLVLTAGGASVHVVTPSSPLGEALMGACKGDDLTVERGGKEEAVEVLLLE